MCVNLSDCQYLGFLRVEKGHKGSPFHNNPVKPVSAQRILLKKQSVEAKSR